MTPLSRSCTAVSLLTVFFPEKKPAAECESVVSNPASWWQTVQLGGVAAANDDLVEFEGGHELDDDLVDAVAPFRDAETLQTVEPEIGFVGLLSVREMPELHGHEGTVGNQRR